MPNNAINRYNEWVSMFEQDGSLNPTYHVPAAGCSVREYTGHKGLYYVKLTNAHRMFFRFDHASHEIYIKSVGPHDPPDDA